MESSIDEGAMAKLHYIIMEELLELDCSIRGMQITQRKVIDSSFYLTLTIVPQVSSRKMTLSHRP